MHGRDAQLIPVKILSPFYRATLYWRGISCRRVNCYLKIRQQFREVTGKSTEWHGIVDSQLIYVTCRHNVTVKYR